MVLSAVERIFKPFVRRLSGLQSRGLIGTLLQQLRTKKRTRFQLRRFISGRNPFAVMQYFPTWLIVLYDHKHVPNINVNLTALEEVLQHPLYTRAKTPGKATFVAVSGADLGFTKPYTYEELLNRAKSDGIELKFCPPRLVPFLREQYSFQEKGTRVTVAMQPIPDFLGRIHIFVLTCSEAGVLWLSGVCCAWAEYKYDISERWVFRT